jgi:hypothetical protein
LVAFYLFQVAQPVLFLGLSLPGLDPRHSRSFEVAIADKTPQAFEVTAMQ